MSALSPDYSKRDCLLPPGCKDLIDVLRLKAAQNKHLPWTNFVPPARSVAQKPADAKRVQLGSQITVRALAALLECKPFQIVADLIELAIMANINQTVAFEVAAKVAAKHGFLAERSGSDAAAP